MGEWTYSGNPATSELDAVRFQIPDVEEEYSLVSNEEIEYAIEQEGSVLAAAACCCEVLGRKFSAQPDTQTGSLKETYSKEAAGYMERAKELRARAQGSMAPFAGGLTHGEKRARAENPEREQPLYRLHQFQLRLGRFRRW